MTHSWQARFAPSIFVLALLLGSFSIAQPAHASASLTISAASINAAGTTLTLTISGVTGSLSPSSGITGVTLHNDSTTQFYLATSTASGSTVTVPIDGFVLSGASPTVDLSASSNLTDGSGNTPTGQTSVAVTNNSTQTATSYPYNNPNFYFIAATSTGTFGGRNWISDSGAGDFFETTLTGTDAQVLLLSGETTDLQISIDGNSTTTINTNNIASGNAYVWVPLFSGLTDAPHTIVVQNLSTGINYYDRTTTVQLKGSSPATATPTGFGPLTVASSAVNAGKVLIDDYAATNYPATGHANTVHWTYMDGGVSFKASAADVWVYANDDSGPLSLYQDGTYLGTVVTGTQDGFFRLYHLGTGLDAAVHTYEIVSSGTWTTPGGEPGGANAYIYSLMLAGGSGLQSPPTSALPIETFYGDSITAGAGLGDNNGREVDASIVSRNIGHTDYRVAYGGQEVSTWGRDNTSLLAGSPHPYRVWVRLGTNDAINGVTLGSVGTPNTFIGDYYTMVSNIRTAVGSGAPIYIEELFPTTSYSTSTRLTYNTAIQTAVTTYMNNTGDTNVKLINTDNWINTTTDEVDGLHPNATGYALMANREIPFAAATGYTVSGPSSGSGTATSTNFTVTIASGATFTGDQTITIGDGGNGGTLTPSVGTASSSSVTVTPTASTTAFTFTYTPASTGTKTLTFTNGQNWTDASSTTYSANVVSMVASPTSIVQNSTGNTISITGTNTSWTAGTPGSPTFALSGGSGASITSQSVTDATHATVTIAAGSTVGTLTITDPNSGATTTLSVTAAPSATASVSAGGGGGPISGPLSFGYVNTPVFATGTQTSQIKPETAALNLPAASAEAGLLLQLNRQLHDIGTDIQALQQFLNSHSFTVATTGPGSAGRETTYFGIKTYDALVRFQAAHELPTTGYLGPLTRALISALSSRAATDTISYVATDQSGLTATSTRTVIIEAPSIVPTDAASTSQATSTAATSTSQ